MFNNIFHFAGCKKLDTSALENNNTLNTLSYNRFFNTNRTSSDKEGALVNYIKKLNTKENFVGKTIKQIGYPRWDKACTIASNNLRTMDDSSDVYYIPFVRDSQNFVNAFMIISFAPSDTLLRYAQDWQYSTLQNNPTSIHDSAEYMAVFFMKFDNYVFGHNKFTITDSTLFKYGIHKALLVTLDTLNSRTAVPPMSCQSATIYWIDCPFQTPTPHCNTPDGSCDGCVNCTSSLFWGYCSQTGGSGPVPGPGPLGWPSTNGGPTGGGPIGGGGGWVPIYDNVGGYNANAAPRPIIDTSISYSYPCLKKIIDTLQQFGNLNRTAQIALSTMFGENKYIHLTLKMDPNLDSTIDAETSQMYTQTIPPDLATSHYYATISFSPYLMANATKEYIAATVTHECMHAYIDYVYLKYQLQDSIDGVFVDSNYIKTKFPIFWRSFGIGTTGPIQQHQLIANNWTQIIANSLYSFSNNNITPVMKDSLYRALAWGGLYNTNVFKTKTDSCMIMAINVAGKFKNVPIPLSVMGHPSCGNFNFNASSLKFKNPCE